jgi:flagellar biosynthesis protein FlhF
VKIKKFTAPTELEAIEKIRQELGTEALVINVRKTQPRGLFAFLRKPAVEVTAAYDDGSDKEVLEDLARAESQAKIAATPQAAAVAAKNSDFESMANAAQLEAQIAEKDDRIKMLSDMLLTTGDMLSRAQSQMSVARQSPVERERIYQNNLLQIFYDTLVQNQVSPHIAQEILDDLDNDQLKSKLDINFIVKVVYNSLVKLIGSPSGLLAEPSKGNPQKFAFIGPTGVGKTTTIAKLTADLCLNRGMDVGLITADTYRIAAIEQLKTYGDILGIEVGVAYKPEDLEQSIDDNKNICDIILIDTAGRSHKNVENLAELSEFIKIVPDVEVFLVLSLTTKYEDMLGIVDSFSQIADFKIIFTKMDETDSLGAIVNICHQTGKKLSYITFGQNVPDDIKTVAPGEVAMRLLGLGEED